MITISAIVAGIAVYATHLDASTPIDKPQATFCTSESAILASSLALNPLTLLKNQKQILHPQRKSIPTLLQQLTSILPWRQPDIKP